MFMIMQTVNTKNESVEDKRHWMLHSLATEKYNFSDYLLIHLCKC